MEEKGCESLSKSKKRIFVRCYLLTGKFQCVLTQFTKSLEVSHTVELTPLQIFRLTQNGFYKWN